MDHNQQARTELQAQFDFDQELYRLLKKVWLRGFLCGLGGALLGTVLFHWMA